MKVWVAISSSDGYTVCEGVWDASKYTAEDVEKELTEYYVENYGYEPEFGDHCIEITESEVCL